MRRPSEPPISRAVVAETCDWGDCHREAEVLRYAMGDGWLPACLECAADADPDDLLPIGAAWERPTVLDVHSPLL